jgi:hypothetical protein
LREAPDSLPYRVALQSMFGTASRDTVGMP